jgi:hypothetical protein
MYEPEILETPARYRCVACAWMLSDPNFRKEEPRYFPSDRIDRRIEWQKQNPGYDLYEPRSAACQLGITVSHLNHMIRKDRSAPVIMGRGMIACNTPDLQDWWDGKTHHRRTL